MGGTGIPDCSRGFSKVAAAQYIQKVQDQASELRILDEAQTANLETIAYLREDLKTVKAIGQELARKLRECREVNLQLKLTIQIQQGG